MNGDRVQAITCSLDAMRALLWQHDNAEKLKSLITLKQQWYELNHCQFWSNWYRDVFDPRTANDFGLGVWARILNISLGVEVPSSRNKAAFGFGTHHKNFENGNFARAYTSEQSLTIDQKRLVVRLRYFQLTSRGTVPEINDFLKELFGDHGLVWVHDSLDMTYATYFFGFQPDSQLSFITELYDLFPRPAGVGVRFIVQPRDAFGFGVNNLNFNNGSFGA
ncbi:DUF2612 domain-containing protein [Pseudomonas chlororaphis]|uniref:DUF2612 domain-containing protein n=1 Tax=Pseudomonas chlororaphis TaxID=587753 RepID=UPI00215A72CC|nr:DUF2612 domain-containing protein [Pseudomonas chlororaphis]UVE47620.1 DUF2612 domain-containing protein [Pseudomonas chlororaphis]